MKQYTFIEEPRSADYRMLIAYAHRWCAEAQMVVRDGVALSPHAATILESLKPWLLEWKRASEWTGTKLHGRTAQLFRYKLCPETVSVLGHAVSGLYEWVQPDCPEDLALLFLDGTPWLTSIAHERDAYLTMTVEGAAMFFVECGELSRLLGEPSEVHG